MLYYILIYNLGTLYPVYTIYISFIDVKILIDGKEILFIWPKIPTINHIYATFHVLLINHFLFKCEYMQTSDRIRLLQMNRDIMYQGYISKCNTTFNNNVYAFFRKL
jgi:hypothetical protein